MLRAYTDASVYDLYFDAVNFHKVKGVNFDKALFCEL